MSDRKDKLQALLSLYEAELGDVIQTGETLDLTRLPKLIQTSAALVTARSTSFSNISAVTTVNFGLTHLLAQLRPYINDSVYSNDSLGINYLSINLDRSGGGKDQSINAILKACKPAFSMIQDRIKVTEKQRAVAIALRELRKENKEATEADIDPSALDDIMRVPPPIMGDASSTRNGMITNINEHTTFDYGALSVFIPEFGTSMKTGQNMHDVLELLIVLYDQGVNSSSLYKTKELRQSAIEGAYVSALMHSSPKSLFGDEKTKAAISTLFSSALARRVWFTYAEDFESIENNPVATTIAEARSLANARRNIISNNSAELEAVANRTVERMLSSQDECAVRFSEDAQKLYTDYYERNRLKAELLEAESVQQIELNGRAFKMARLAAVWALFDGTNEISHSIMSSAIYFAEYTERYLDKFATMVSSKPFILLGDKFKNGSPKMTLDSALTNGFISRISSDFKELLDPLNSYLRSHGVVSYSADDKTFYYSPFKKVESVGEYGVSYTKVPGVPKLDRVAFLNNFSNYKTGSLKLLENIVKADTVFSLFKYKDEGSTKHKRGMDFVDSTTKVICIDVDESEIRIDEMHEYLSAYKHIISTTSDSENKFKFRILLPVNIELEADNRYRCVVAKVATDLLIKADPAGFTASQPFYGYADAEVFTNQDGDLYDVTDIITECTQEKDLIEASKPALTTKAQQQKEKDKIMHNPVEELDFAINAPNGMGQLRIYSLWMRLAELKDVMTKDEALSIISYVMSTWASPLQPHRLKRLEERFLHQFKG